MKKLIKILWFLLLPFYSAFGLGEIGVSIHDTTLVAGDVAYIPVYVDSSVTGKEISSYNLQFSFSSSTIQIDSAFSTGTLTESWGGVTYNVTNDKISVAAAGTTDLSGTGILLYLRVEAVNRGGSYVRFEGGLQYNYFNEGTPPIVVRNGYINVNAKPTISVYPDTEILPVGNTKQFNVQYGTPPYTWSVTDGSVATINTDGLLTAVHKGITRIVATDANGIVDTSGDITVRAFQLTCRDTAFYKGQVLELPVYVSDLTGLNYTAGEFTVEYNQNAFIPLEIVTNGTLLNAYPVPEFSYRNNKLKIAFAGAAPLSGSGVLLKIKLRITSDGIWGTELALKDILFNETDIGFPGPRSRLTAWNLITLPVFPNTASLLAGDTLRFTTRSGTPPYSWTVSNASYASIDNGGLLTALSGGVVTVSVQDVYGNTGTSGNIEIYDTEVAIPDTTAEPGATIEIPIYMGNLSPTYSIVSLQTNICFDSSVIKFKEVVKTGTSTAGWVFSANNMGNKVTIAGANTTGFNTKGAIVKLKFTVSSSVVAGNHTNICMEKFLFNEGTPNAKIETGSLRIVTTNPPNLPNNLVVIHDAIDSCNTAHITWADNSSNELGFIIEYSVNVSNAWSILDTLNLNTTFYTDTNLIDGTEYFFRVAAFNNAGFAGYSNVDSIITVMKQPTALTGAISGGDRVNLIWDDNSASEDGYIILRQTNSGNTGNYISSMPVLDSVGANVRTYVDTTVIIGGSYSYVVYGYNSKTNSKYSNFVTILVTDVENGEKMPTKFALFQNYPNPFNPSTEIKYSLPEAGEVNISVYNMLGEKIATLVNSGKNAGYHQVTWNAENIPSGVYFISTRIISNGKTHSFTKKAMLLK
jgi:hypothetical protein